MSMLAKQLKSWNLQRGNENRYRTTFLYDAKEAKSLTVDDAFEIGKEGFDDLCEIDSEFHKFRKPLFSGVPLEREKKTHEEIEKQNHILSRFLKLLSKYFTMDASIKVFEHLIRNYRVHEFNVDDCMACALVYHDTPEFQRFLKVLKIEDTQWEWLKDIQKHNLSLSREFIVQRSLTDHAILNFVCDMAKAVSKEIDHPILNSFFAVFICEVLDRVQEVSEEMMRRFMSVIAAGLKFDAPENFRKAIWMIILQLCTKAALSDKVNSALLTSLFENVRAGEEMELILLGSHIYRTQTQYEHIPEPFLQALFAMDVFCGKLTELIQKGLNSKHFLSVLLKKLIKRVARKDDVSVLEFLNRMISEVPLESYILDIASMVFSQFQMTSNDRLKSLIRTLDVHYPILLDQSVHLNLQKAKDEETKQRMIDLVFGSPNEALHTNIKGTSFTLLAAVDAPDAVIRKTALELLQNVDLDTRSDEMKSFLSSALLRRLTDDNFEVASAALCCPLDVIQNPSNLWTALQSLLELSLQNLSSGNKLAESTGIRIVDFLTENFSSFQNDSREEIFWTLMEHLIPSSQLHLTISIQIGIGFGKIQHPVAQSLAEHVDFLSFDPEEHTFQTLNRVLISNLVRTGEDPNYGMEWIQAMFSKTGIRFRCFLCMAIEHDVCTRDSALHKWTLLQCFLHQMRHHFENLSDDEDSIELTIEQRCSFSAILLSTLKTVALSIPTKDRASIFNTERVNELLYWILKAKRICEWMSEAASLVEALIDGPWFPFLLQFLCLPRIQNEACPIVDGLSLCDSGIFQMMREDILQDILVPLCTLMHHQESSVREAAMNLSEKVHSQLSSVASSFAKHMSILLEYLIENKTSILTDMESVTRLCKEFVATPEHLEHKLKKQKTLKTHAIQTEASPSIWKNFLNQIRRLENTEHTKQLGFLLEALKGSVHDAELLIIAIPILEKFRNAEELELNLLAAEVVSLLRPKVMNDLVLSENAAWVMETFLNCFDASVSDCVKKAALDVITVNWIKNVEKNFEIQIWTAILRLANTDANPEIAKRASEIAAMWPIHEELIQKTIVWEPDDDMAETGTFSTSYLCFWMLDWLQSKPKLSNLGVVSSTQKLLLKIRKDLKGQELTDRALSTVRAAMGLLDAFFRQGTELEDCKNFKIDLLLDYLKWTQDSVIRGSILEVLQKIFPYRKDATRHVLEVLSELLKLTSLQIKENEFRKTTSDISSIIRAWAHSNEAFPDLWHCLIPAIGSMPETRRFFVMKAILDGMENRRVEGLTNGLVAILLKTEPNDEESTHWMHLALDLCKAVQLSERNQTIARTLREMEIQHPSAVHTAAPRNAIKLAIACLKESSEIHNALSSMQLGAAGSSIGFGSILIETFRQMNLLFRQRNVSPTQEIHKALESIYCLLSLLESSMNDNTFLATLVHLIQESDLTLQLTALELFRKKLNKISQMEDRSWTLSDEVYNVFGFFEEALDPNSKRDDLFKQSILATLQQMLQEFGQERREVFLEMIPKVLFYIQATNLEIRTSAMACMTALVRELGETILPYLSKLMPIVLDSIQDFSKGKMKLQNIDSEEHVWIGNLAMIQALFETLGAFLNPYLTSLVSLTLDPQIPETPTVQELIQSIREDLPRRVPIRLLLPPLLNFFDTLSSIDRNVLCPYLNIVDRTASVMDPVSIEIHSEQMGYFFRRVLDLRSSEGTDHSEIHAIESTAISALLSYVMKLNEKQFKPLLDSMLDWMFEDMNATSRLVVGFRFLSETMQKLKSIFVPFVPTFFENAIELCSIENGKKLWRDEHIDPIHLNAFALKFFIYQCLYRSLLYDEDDILDTTMLERIVNCLTKDLKRICRPSEAFLEALGDLNARKQDFKQLDHFGKDLLSQMIGTYLSHLGYRQTLQKSICYKVLKCCTRSSSSYVRSLCLYIIREIVSHTKEAFSPMIPETLPRIVEMLEVQDPVCRGIAVEILKLFEGITGESFDHCTPH